MVNTDVRRILTAQGLRALAYGFGAVLLGASLERRGWSSAEVGVLLTAIVAGTALMSVVVGTFGDRIGRRRLYGLLFFGLAGSGVAFALADQLWLLCLVALTGTMSTDVVESGPFTSLEQVMLPMGLDARARMRVFGTYNAVASLLGSLGALAVGGPALLRHWWPGLPADERFFLAFVPVSLAGAAVAWSLSSRVEVDRPSGQRGAPLHRSRKTVVGLSALFAADAFGGAFILQSFIAYWFTRQFNVSIGALGVVFFALGILQAASFLVATRLAERVGLLNTMVFSHLPSNIMLALIPLSPNLAVAIALLLSRFALSQMDVPTRQAYVIALVDPDERMAAAAYTNTARYVVRPLGPILAGAAQRIVFGLPFFLGGGIKIFYDLALWSWLRHVPLPPDVPDGITDSAVASGS